MKERPNTQSLTTVELEAQVVLEAMEDTQGLGKVDLEIVVALVVIQDPPVQEQEALDHQETLVDTQDPEVDHQAILEQITEEDTLGEMVLVEVDQQLNPLLVNRSLMGHHQPSPIMPQLQGHPTTLHLQVPLTTHLHQVHLTMPQDHLHNNLMPHHPNPMAHHLSRMERQPLAVRSLHLVL